MWLSQRGSREIPQTPFAQTGEVSGSGPKGVSAVTDVENRDMRIFAPGGYSWRPAREDSVLVIKAGPENEEPCVAGEDATEKSMRLEPGELRIALNECSIYFTRDGRLLLNGKIFINGVPY